MMLEHEQIDDVLNKAVGGIVFIYYKDLACDLIKPKSREEIERRLSSSSFAIIISQDENIYFVKGNNAYRLQNSAVRERLLSRCIFMNKGSLLTNNTNHICKLIELLGDVK